MKSRDFAFWLQGFFELGGGDNGLTPLQVAGIKQHLGLVFQHDPDISAPSHPPVGTPLPAVRVPAATYPYPGSSGDVPRPLPLMIC